MRNVTSSFSKMLPGIRIQCLAVVAVLFFAEYGSAQLSKPIAHNDAVDVENNKFLQRRPELDYKNRTSEEDEEIISSSKRCPTDIHLRWMAQVSSAVVATPLIADLFSDNKKEILVPSHVHYLEALEADDGAAAVGWPVFHKSHLHGSPFMYDIDRDGILDIGIATYNGEIQFFKDTGEKMMHSMSVAPLRVKKHWFVGLSPDPVDHSHMDVGKDKVDEEVADETEKKDKDKETKEEETVKITKRRLMAEEQTVEDNGHRLTDAAADSFKVFDEGNEQEEDEDDGTYYNANDNVKRNSRFRGGIYDEQDVDDEIYQDLDRGTYTTDDEWDDQYMEEHRTHGDFEYVYLDGHVFSTPVVADIDGDGADELVVAVSYFFDADFYSHKDHDLLPKDIDTDKYLAGGVVVFDLAHRYVKWVTHLDMSTKSVKYAAYMTSSPSVLDIDQDGHMEIVVGNHAGFLYVLDSNGNAKEGWPKQMGFIAARSLVEDLNGDGKIEILAVDLLGNVAMFDIHGKELWERHVMSAIGSSPTAGDVTGNGQLDIVFGTVSGHVYVLDPKTGQDRPPFPFRVHGAIHSPIAITKLRESPGQHLVFAAFDGFLYVIDGESACVDARDIGEDSHSLVLVDDVTDNGNLDLIVTTMNGNVLVFETDAPYHPLRTKTAEVRGTESAVSREGHLGVFASKESRRSRDIRGDKFIIRFSIVDKRPKQRDDQYGPYNVTAVLKNVGVNEMNMGGSPVIGVVDTFSKPGEYELVLPCPRTRTTALIQITLTDNHKREVRDEFSLSFHMHWYKFVKWLVAIPFTAMAVAAVFIRPNIVGLPT